MLEWRCVTTRPAAKCGLKCAQRLVHCPCWDVYNFHVCAAICLKLFTRVVKGCPPWILEYHALPSSGYSYPVDFVGR